MLRCAGQRPANSEPVISSPEQKNDAVHKEMANNDEQIDCASDNLIKATADVLPLSILTTHTCLTDVQEQLDNKPGSSVGISFYLDSGNNKSGLDISPQVDDSRAACGLALPNIAIQAASPTVMSPTEEHDGELCHAMEKYAQAWFNMEEVCGIADAEMKAVTEIGDQECHGLPGVDHDVRAAGEIPMDIEEDRPLSPADYTLEDDGELILLGSHTEEYQTPSVLDNRLPSPSQFSLLVESAEENELARITNTTIPDDVYAIPDPATPSNGDMSIYFEMQYGKNSSGDTDIQKTGNTHILFVCFITDHV